MNWNDVAEFRVTIPSNVQHAAEARALVTENVPDYRRLEADALARGEPIPGLVFTTNRQFPRGEPATIGRLVRALDALMGERRPTATMFLKPTNE